MNINHIGREGNKTADWLATSNLTLNTFDFYVMETPLKELQNIIFNDISDTYIPRYVRLDL